MYMSEVSFIPFEIALKIADAAVFARTAKHLKNIEVAVLHGTLQGKKYDEIAGECGYAAEYIKHDVGPKLWQLLSSSLGEKVSKTNLMAVLAQRVDRTWQDSGEDKLKPEEIEQPTNKELASNLIPPAAAWGKIEQLENREQESNSKSPIAAYRAIANLEFLEPPIGLLPLDSPLYIERPPVENRCYDEVMRSGALIRITGANQMGKTSLMLRILDRAKQHNTDFTGAPKVHAVAISLQQVDRVIFQDIDRFLRWFCTAVTRKLHLPYPVDDRWSNKCSSHSNCTNYFEDCILPEINGILIIALDGVDEVFLHPKIAGDFFSLLHSWYEQAARENSNNLLWKKLRSLLVYSTEIELPSKIDRLLFNAGLELELKEFTSHQVSDLAQCYGLNLSESELSKLMKISGGHPFLVQQSLYHLARQNSTGS